MAALTVGTTQNTHVSARHTQQTWSRITANKNVHYNNYMYNVLHKCISTALSPGHSHIDGMGVAWEWGYIIIHFMNTCIQVYMHMYLLNNKQDFIQFTSVSVESDMYM